MDSLWRLSPKVQDCVHDGELSENEGGQRAEVDGMDAAADDEIAQDTEENQEVNAHVKPWPGVKRWQGNERRRQR